MHEYSGTRWSWLEPNRESSNTGSQLTWLVCESLSVGCHQAGDSSDICVWAAFWPSRETCLSLRKIIQERTTPVVKYSSSPFAGGNLTVLYLRERGNQTSLGLVMNCSNLRANDEFSKLWHLCKHSGVNIGVMTVTMSFETKTWRPCQKMQGANVSVWRL